MDSFEKAFPAKYSFDWCLKIKSEGPPFLGVRLAVLFFGSSYILSGFVCGGVFINLLRVVGGVGGFYLMWAAESLDRQIDKARYELRTATPYLQSVYFKYGTDIWLKIEGEDLPFWRGYLILGTIFYLWVVTIASGNICGGVVINTLLIVGGAGCFYLLFEAQALVDRLQRARNELWIASSFMWALEKERNL